MRTARRTQTYNISGTIPFSPYSVVNSVGGRNLEKYELGGVIFGCKTSTMKECQSKQLFGLPAQHFSYVKNIDPGLPIFLFNYSDRKLHGIFEASSKGQMYIDPYAWIDDYSDLDRTQYPAQVKIRVRLQCQPLSEDKFAQVIADNYYCKNHFWFELNYRQTNKLISLLASFAFAPGCNLKWRTVSPSLPSTQKEGGAFETEESNTQHLTSSSRRRTSFTEITSLDGDIKALEEVKLKEVDDNEMNLVYVKLKELALGHESRDLSMSDNVNDTHDENEVCNVKKEYLEVPAGLEEKEKSSSPPVEHQYTIGQLMQEVEELMAFKKIQTQTNCYLEQKLRETELEIQHLMDRCTMLESAFNLSLTLTEKTVIQSHEQDVEPKESLFLKVNFDGESWLSTVDLYCPSQNVIKFLYSMDSVHSYASIIQLNGELYVFGGGNGGSYSSILDKWTFYLSLNKKKGSLTVVSFTNKMFAVVGTKGIDSFSDTEVLDLDIGRWISVHSMLDQIVASAAVEFNSLLYTTSGIDHLDFVPSVKVFDPSFGMDDETTNDEKP